LVADGEWSLVWSLDERGLQDLTKNDVFWGKVVEITSVGERGIYCVSALASARPLPAMVDPSHHPGLHRHCDVIGCVAVDYALRAY
jgi:hypothetical protein